MPFFNAKQLAGSATWKGNSSATAIGGAARVTSMWGYPDKAFAIRKAGQGALFQNVGTDLDGSSVDIKVVASRVIGTDTDFGVIELAFCDASYSGMSTGDQLLIDFSASQNGEADFTVSFLKHGTSKAANVSACPTVYDIDSSNWGWSAPNQLFNGAEGVSLAGNTGTCYVTYDKEMKVDASKGYFYSTTSWNTGATGKDPKGAVTMMTDASSFKITFSAWGAGVDMAFDPFKAISPGKTAKITG